MMRAMALRFYSGPDYRALPREPQPWVIKSLVPVGGLTNIYGKPKSGKSFAALGMALAVASGAPEWNGFEVRKHGRVAYLQIDTPREEWADRIVRVAAAGYDDTNIYYADMLTVPYPYNVLDPQHYNELKIALAELKPVLVVIDTLRESFSGDENDSNTMRNVISSLVAASRYDDGSRSAIILLSHARKDGIMSLHGGDDLMDDNRGSSYVPGRMDVIIRMTQRTFVFKGRATGQQRIEIEQDKELGLVYLKGQRDKWNIVNAARKLLKSDIDPRLKTVRGIARILSEQDLTNGISDETIRKWPEYLALFGRSEPEVVGGEAA